MTLDPMVRRAIEAQLDSGAPPAVVAEWLGAMVPLLGWDEVAVEAFQAAREGTGERGAADLTRAVVQADLDEGLLALRSQMAELGRIAQVQVAEIFALKCATSDKIIKAHTMVTDQYRKHLETLRDCLPEDPTKRQATVGDLMASLFAVRLPVPALPPVVVPALPAEPTP